MSRASTPAGPIFPPLRARNLNGRTLVLPAAFVGARNIVMVAFHRSDQQAVDSWFPTVDKLLISYPNLRAYEIPMMAHGYALMRPFIDGGMARAIADPVVRERTLTVYTNVAQSMAALKISSPEQIAILLVDRNGALYWRSEGAYNDAKGAHLQQALAAWAH